MTELSLPIEYNITGFSLSATASRRMSMLSASRRWRFVSVVIEPYYAWMDRRIGQGRLAREFRDGGKMGSDPSRETGYIDVDGIPLRERGQTPFFLRPETPPQLSGPYTSY